MQIVIPDNQGCDRQVIEFLGSLDSVQCIEALERMEIYERFSVLEAIQKHKLEKLEDNLYELRVPIANIKLRFFGVLQGSTLTLVYVFSKKSKRIPSNELRAAKRKASTFLLNTSS